MKIFRKLVRDRIPEIIEKDGKNAVTRVLDEREFLTALENKLLEEVQELRVDSADKKEEIADIYEVLDAFIGARGFSREEIAALQLKKRAKRGGFSKRLFLERVE
jgi:predicted house-cleaning noncanonical NTP pyrophosphatase (MazG superfamily)